MHAQKYYANQYDKDFSDISKESW